MDRTILHCDCNSFFASCEITLDPKLKDVPMAVCGNPENRHGIILAKNDLAKKFNVQTAETIYKAKQKCPGLILVSPHYKLYEEFSVKCNNIYKEYTDLVEPFGIDESWLDVTASRLLFGDGKKIADEIRARFREELGLTCSVGVSFNKAIAKLGSDYKKPDATTVISRDNFERIVHPLPVSALLFAGKNSTDALKKLNIFTIGDLANANRTTISKHLGKSGEMLYDYSVGIDDSPVQSIYTVTEQKSISNGRTFKRDLKTDDDIKRGVMLVAEELSLRMRHNHVKATNISVNIKYSDFTSKGKQHQLDFSTNLVKDITSVAVDLIYAIYNGKPIRLITISGTNLIPDTESFQQINFFSDTQGHEKQQRVEDAIYKIRTKFGKNAVGLGKTIHSEDILSSTDKHN